MKSSINILSRRDFLSRSARLGSLAALSALTDIPLVMQRALAEGSIGMPGPSGRVRKVIFIFLRGANDGLNSLIPIADPAYAASRETIALPKNTDPAWNYSASGPALWTPSGSGPTFGDVSTLTSPGYAALPAGNGFAALHPSLKFLVPVYNSGNLAMIHRVGYPRQSRSHFDSQNYWENGMPLNDTRKEGIFYRAMVESGLARSSPLTGVSFQSSLPMILRGSAAAMTNIEKPENYGLLGVPKSASTEAKAKALLAVANSAEFADKQSRELLRLQYDNLNRTLGIFDQMNFSEAGNTFQDDEVTDGDQQWADENGGRGYYLFPTSDAKNGGWRRTTGNAANKYVVPTSSYDFFKNLKAAAMVLNNTDAIVAGTQIDGFDTHSSQGAATGQHANLLRRIGWAMYALRKYFTAYGSKCKWEDVTVVTLSEFGRTTKENSDNGTDHAEASVMWVAGGGVKGFKADGFGGALRSGIFNCGPSDPVAWQTGPTGTMFKADSRYLGRSTDYRQVLGKIIRDHLGATQDQLNRIIPGYASESVERLKLGGTQTRDGVRIAAEPDIL